MKTMRRLIASLLLSTAAAAVVLAQTTPMLDVKMGLWEMTTTTEMGGDMPGVDTSKMTPAQKAQIEAMMKSMASGRTNVNKTCMTKEKFNQSNFMGQQGANCKQTINVNTSTTLDGTFTCTGERAMTGQMHMDALSSSSLKAIVKSAATQQGKTMTLTIAITGKWLGADRGDTK